MRKTIFVAILLFLCGCAPSFERERMKIGMPMPEDKKGNLSEANGDRAVYVVRCDYLNWKYIYTVKDTIRAISEYPRWTIN